MNRSLVKEIMWDDYGYDYFSTDYSDRSDVPMDVSERFYILGWLNWFYIITAGVSFEKFGNLNPFSNYAR
jgi:hypothetical protein